MEDNSKDFFFLDANDLTDEQIKTTQETYLKYAGSYVFNYERAEGALEKARPYTIDPFLTVYQKLKLIYPILFAGCGSCRDLQVAADFGIKTYGVDTSPKMLEVAKKIGITAPLRTMNILNLDFPKESLDGIFCETALSHIKKADLNRVLTGFTKILRPRGIMLLGFRLGDGRTYCTDDGVGGRRYNTTITQKEAEQLIDQIGLKTLSIQISSHQVNKRPKFIDFIVQK